jgi:hypothetical protein
MLDLSSLFVSFYTNINGKDMAIESLLKDLDSLKKINSEISRQNVIQWFNDNDVDYFHMTDIEMYIQYIQKANEN